MIWYGMDSEAVHARRYGEKEPGQDKTREEKKKVEKKR
jgi:hypothetical protein